MKVPEVIIIVALICGAIGMIGGQVMTWLVDRSEHPPDKKRKNKKGEISK